MNLIDIPEFKYLLEFISWSDVTRALDVIIIAYIFYKILIFIRGTRALPMVAGLSFLLILYWLAVKVGLVTLSWILGNFLGSVILVIVVLFQDDLRRGLTKVGLISGLSAEGGKKEQHNAMRAVARAVSILAQRKIGAIIVLRRDIGLDDYTEHAVQVDALVSHQLLVSLFLPQSPLHDGAVVIEGNRIVVAGAVLPLSFNPRLSSNLGTRHRAALGLTERTDALAIVVSEERGTISLGKEGKLFSDHNEKSLFDELVFYSALHKRSKKKKKGADGKRAGVQKDGKNGAASIDGKDDGSLALAATQVGASQMGGGASPAMMPSTSLVPSSLVPSSLVPSSLVPSSLVPSSLATSPLAAGIKDSGSSESLYARDAAYMPSADRKDGMEEA